MAYSYDCPEDSAFQNSIFIHYDLLNRSLHQYHNVFIGVNASMWIGNPDDDYIGCDSVLNTFFGYNKDQNDDGLRSSGYGQLPPAQSITFLNQSMVCFITYGNYYYHSMGYPFDPEDYYNYLQGKWKDGTSLTYGFLGYGGSQPVKYHFPGDPNDPEGWSQYTVQVSSEKNRWGLGSSGPFLMAPGDTISLDLALTFARDYQGDHLSSVSLLKERIEKIRFYYGNDSIPCGSVFGIEENKKDLPGDFYLYPNPATDFITIRSVKSLNKIDFKIYDITGQLIKAGKMSSQSIIQIGHLKPGIYLLRLESIHGVAYKKFIKKM